MLLYALLGILRYAPMSGYELEQFISISITHFWNAKLSQIYRTLKKMEEGGLVTSEMQEQDGARSKRVYTITQAGIDEFEAWQSQMDTELDEIKQPLLVRTFFMGTQGKAEIAAQMELWRSLHEQHLNMFENILPQNIQKVTQEHGIHPPAKDEIFWKATLRFGIMYEKMILEWLAEMQEAIEELGD